MADSFREPIDHERQVRFDDLAHQLAMPATFREFLTKLHGPSRGDRPAQQERAAVRADSEG